jgi:hypothetical protein
VLIAAIKLNSQIYVIMHKKSSRLPMNSWIFTVDDATSGRNMMPALEVYLHRMKDGFWGFKQNVRYKHEIRENDFVLFYLAGKDGQKFVGSSILNSRFQKLTRSEYVKICHRPFLMAKHGVYLKDTDVWNEPISIRPMLKKLSIIEPFLPKWGGALHSSITPLPESDLKTILEFETFSEIKNNSKETPKLTNDASNKKMAHLTRKILDAMFQREVRKNYGFACAVCGKKRTNRLNHYETESCHIYPREKNGRDDLRNGIAMCRLHHWAFDNGLFSIRNDYSIIVESRIRRDLNYEEIWRYENEHIAPPANKKYMPHEIFLGAHRKLHGFD